MFFDRNSGCEQPYEVTVTQSAGQRVQPLRLNPLQGGTWSLPSFHPDVPVVLRSAETGFAEKVFADFALQAHANGVPLPSGRFTTVNNAINSQWKGFVKAALKDHESPLAMSMQIHGTDESINVSIGVPGHVEILRMKPLVESLNAAKEGLGWWLVEQVNRSTGYNFPIYTPEKAADFYCQYECTFLTNADFVDTLNEREGYEEDEKKSEEELREDHQGFWPSDLIDAVDGHTWLLKQQRYDQEARSYVPIGEKPAIASDSDAAQFILQPGADPYLVRAVQAFLDLSRELDRSDSALKNARAPTGYDDEYAEAIGASCVVVWDDKTLLMECIDHWEVHLQTCGNYTEDHIRFATESLSDVAIADLIQSIKDFVERHRAISKAFSYLEICT